MIINYDDQYDQSGEQVQQVHKYNDVIKRNINGARTSRGIIDVGHNIAKPYDLHGRKCDSQNKPDYEKQARPRSSVVENRFFHKCQCNTAQKNSHCTPDKNRGEPEVVNP